MSKIPAEHEAARSLEESFRKLGKERGPQGRRQPTAHSVWRALVVGVSILLLASAAAAGTRMFMADGGSVGSEHRFPRRLKQTPAYRALALARTADPRESTPWGLRGYTGARGDTCLIVGRVVGARLGLLQGGRFTELTSGASGMCTDLDRLHVFVTVRSYGDIAMPGGRTVLYGVADRTIRALTLVTQAGKRRSVPIAADGTYIVVLLGIKQLQNAHLDVEGEHGRTVRTLSR